MTCPLCGNGPAVKCVMACARTKERWVVECCNECDSKLFPAGLGCIHRSDDPNGCGNPAPWAEIYP